MATPLYCSFPPTINKPQFHISSSPFLSQLNFNTRQLKNSVIKSPVYISISAVSTPIADTTQSNSTSRFDLHRLEPGYPLIIGGINIPHDRGCEAHSDKL